MYAPDRIRVIAFFTLMLVLAGCLSAGCTAPVAVQGQNETGNGTDLGFRPVTVSGERAAISFREATAALSDLVPGAGNRSASNSSDPKILYVRGTALDRNGDAASWIFVVQDNNRTSIVTAEQKGTTLSEWRGAFSRQEIRMESVISPADLFRKNGPAIFLNEQENQTLSRDLVLSMNNYTLTIAGKGEKRVLVFDAGTGALTRSNG
nr:hypothetical protein [uncultured Methanoregula sp.]